MADGSATASIDIRCPVCDVGIPVTMTLTLKDTEFAHVGMAYVETSADVDAVWTHMFTHQLDKGLPEGFENG